MSNKQDDIDTLLDELKSTKTLAGFTPITPKPTDQPDINEETINDFIMKRASLIIQQGVDTLEALKNNVKSSGNPEEINAYSNLVAAVASSIDGLNKINLQNKKNKAAKEIKQMDIDHQKGVIESRTNVTNNILVAPREEIMKRLFEEIEQKVPINIDASDIPLEAGIESEKVVLSK